MSTIGERIADLRLRRGMTQVELAEAIGENKQLIYKYEHGIITNIPLSKVEAIAKALRCPPVVLTGWQPKADLEREEQHELLLKLFDQLPPASQEAVLVQLRALAQFQKAQDDR